MGQIRKAEILSITPHVAQLGHICLLAGLYLRLVSVVFAGKTLTDTGDASKGLRSMGIKDGSKVMLLGTKVKRLSPCVGVGESRTVGV